MLCDECRGPKYHDEEMIPNTNPANPDAGNMWVPSTNPSFEEFMTFVQDQK